MDPGSPGEEFSDGYDENLLGDEEDRRRLAQMTEKEREQELFNRSERRETLKTRFEIERKLKTKKREGEKQTNKQARKRLRASEIYSDESSDESDEYTPSISNKVAPATGPRMTTRSALLSSSSSSSSSEPSSDNDDDSSSSSSESETKQGRFDRDEDSNNIQDDFQMTLADLKSLQLRRDRIEQWIYAPFFKETAIGLFVKISVANHSETNEHMYRVAQIVDITQGSRIYALNNDKNKTDKFCLVRIGAVERTYAMSYISNRIFDEEDYSKWLNQLRHESLEMPSREYFNKKKRDLHNAINYHFKAEDIAYQVAERNKFNDHPHNYALRKTELLGEYKDAEASGDFKKASEIQSKIDDLEAKTRELEKARNSERFSGITMVNERNRIRNIVESEKALKESKSVKTEDPFTRRKCTPQIVHNKNNTSNVDNSNGDSLGAANSDDKTNKTPINNSSGLKLEPANNSHLEPVKSANDLFQVHASIDLEIDIDI